MEQAVVTRRAPSSNEVEIAMWKEVIQELGSNGAESSPEAPTVRSGK